MSVVFVTGLNNGTALLCILNQLIPMLIFLKEERESYSPEKDSYA